MDNREKKLVKIIFILTIIIISIIIILINIMNNEVEKIEDENVVQDTLVNNEPISKLNTYFMFDLEKVINSLFINIENKNSQKALNVLDSDYIRDNNIDIDNVLEKLEISYSEFLIQEVYSSENEKNGKFYIYGLGKDNQEKSLEDVYFIINVDYKNFTYEIYPTTLDIFLKAKEGKQPTVEYRTIEKNNDNNITITEKDTEALIQKYLYDYKNKINYNIEKAYECLDDNQKKQQYNTIELYEEYIENNVKIKEFAGINSYSKKIKDDYIEYTITDNNGINYIINSKELMNYKIIVK